MNSKEKLKKKEICYCDKCASPMNKNSGYLIKEIYARQIIDVLVCSDCNNEHQTELNWSINHQLHG
jgi:hypothetical protein